MINILHISTSAGGGAGKAAIRLHEALLEKGYNSNFLHIDNSRKSIKNSSKFIKYVKKKDRILRVLGIPSIEDKNQLKVSNRQNDYEHFSFCETSYDIMSHPFYKKADIINLHWVAEFIDYPSFFVQNTKPLVWTLYDLNPFSGGCHYSNGCEGYKKKCSDCPQLLGTINQNNAQVNLLKKIKVMHQIKTPFHIVAVANWMKICSESSALFGKFPHHIIPHASDESVFKVLNKKFCKEFFDIPLNTTTLLFVCASGSPRKGVDLLLESLRLIEKDKVHLMLIGNKLDNLDSEISFTHIDFVSDERVMSLIYNAANVLIIPSLEDNLPLTVLDSFMCGLPVIAFNIGGMKDHLIQNENGIKVQETTSTLLAEGIKNFISDKNLFDSNLIRNNAMNKYSKTVHADSYIELYKMILKNG